MFRSADAHRKIVLGGLTIAAGADGWDPAEIVSALLLVNEQLAQQPERRDRLRQKGIEHLEAREAARKAAKQGNSSSKEARGATAGPVCGGDEVGGRTR